MTGVAVLGAGNGGLAFAGWLASLGVEVTLYNRSAAALEALRADPRVTLTGQLRCTGRLARVTGDLAEAVRHRQLLLVTVPATGHDDLLTALEPHLLPGQTVLLNPGGVGGWLVHRRRRPFAAGASLAEVSNLLYGCRKTDGRTVHVTGLKRRLFLFGLPPALDTEMAAWFPQLVPSPSPVETALNTTNVPVHCPVLATHVDAILAGRLRYFYRDGLDEAAAALTERVEEERAALCRAWGVRRIDLRELYHEASGETLYELLRNRLGESRIAAPRDLQHRFFAEDVPFGLIPMIDLAEVAGVDVPALRGMRERLLQVHDWLPGARRLRPEHLRDLPPPVTAGLASSAADRGRQRP